MIIWDYSFAEIGDEFLFCSFLEFLKVSFCEYNIRGFYGKNANLAETMYEVQ